MAVPPVGPMKIDDFRRRTDGPPGKIIFLGGLYHDAPPGKKRESTPAIRRSRHLGKYAPTFDFSRQIFNNIFLSIMLQLIN